MAAGLEAVDRLAGRVGRLRLLPERRRGLGDLADDVVAGVEAEVVGAAGRGGDLVGDGGLGGRQGAVAVVLIGADRPALEPVLAQVAVAVAV